MDIPRQPREKLKDLVRAYIAGEIFLSAELRDPSLLGMVFMPVMFGAFSYPVEKPQGTVKPDAPVRPVRPTKGVVDTGKEGQKLATDIASVRDRITQVEFRVRWGEASEDELRELQASLDSLMAEQTARVNAAIAAVEHDHRVLLEGYLSDLKTYRKERHAWRALVATWEEGEEGLVNRTAVWETGAKAWGEAIDKNLGVIYAYHKDSLPRGINGYPMFMSCAMLHKLDWDMVRKAIDREIERQKDIDLGDDPPAEGGTP
jgi:hypothetical protein